MHRPALTNAEIAEVVQARQRAISKGKSDTWGWTYQEVKATNPALADKMLRIHNWEFLDDVRYGLVPEYFGCYGRLRDRLEREGKL